MNLSRILALAFFISVPAVNAGSFAAFAVANYFCEKTALGMDPIRAYSVAFQKVASNSLHDPDWELPNWNKAVGGEIYRQCPRELSRLNAALKAQEKREKQEAIARKRLEAEARKKAAAEAKKAADEAKESNEEWEEYWRKIDPYRSKPLL